MPKHTETSNAGPAQLAPGTVVTNDEDRELAAMLAAEAEAKAAITGQASPAQIAAPVASAPVGGGTPPLGGPPGRAGEAMDGIPRFRGAPVVPFSLSQTPDVEGRVVLFEAQTIAVMDRLTDAHAAVYEVPDPMIVSGVATPAQRIAKQYNVWLTDRRQILQAGLMHKDHDGCWIAQTFPGTKTVYPRNILG